MFHLPVIQVGTLCPVQRVRGDAATSCHAPGGGDDWHARTLSQAVDHQMRQLCLLHHLLNLLQLLVVGSPHRGVCCCCRCRREGARRCSSCAERRQTEQRCSELGLKLMVNHSSQILTLVYGRQRVGSRNKVSPDSNVIHKKTRFGAQPTDRAMSRRS